MSYAYKQRKRPQESGQAAEHAARLPSLDALRAGLAQPTAEQKGRRVDLPDAMRAKMEESFGADLAAVKLYESEAVADAGAEAVTRGSEIAFAPGMLDFTSFGGQALLGHELSHVVSQSRGEVTGGGFLNDHALEARADREGAMAAAGRQVAMPAAAMSAVTAAPAAGPMQAKKDDTDPKRGKAKRKIIEDPDSYVDETAEGYNELDPTKWEEREKERSFFGRLFKQKRHFYKARIDRKAYEISPEELQKNRFNPNNVPALKNIQEKINDAGSNMYGKTPEIKNGIRNRAAWMTFQNFADTDENDEGTHKEWDMTEVDHTAFTSKLKNMTRMVHDYPELEGQIGKLHNIIQKDQDEKKKRLQDKKKQTFITDGTGTIQKKKLRKRARRTIDPGKQQEMIQPAPMDGYQPNMSWQQDDVLDPDVLKALQEKKEEDEKINGPKKPKATTIMAAGFNGSYYDPDHGDQSLGNPLRLNGEVEGVSDEAKKKRRDINAALTEDYGTTLDYAANHELGHMLNYALIKERHKNLDSKPETDPLTGAEISLSSERDKANYEDFYYHDTAHELVEEALRQTMPKEEFDKLVRYEEDSLGDDEMWDPDDKLGENEEWATKDIDKKTGKFRKGHIDFEASGLGATEGNRGYTTEYGATNASEFFAEAFADVYQNGSAARPTSIKLVQLYEAKMADAKKANRKG